MTKNEDSIKYINYAQDCLAYREKDKKPYCDALKQIDCKFCRFYRKKKDTKE